MKGADTTGPAPGASPADGRTHRMEGFSDGFFAIVITLLVLELRPPELPQSSSDFHLRYALLALWPSFTAYALSFVNIYILWVAHHELMRITTRTSTQFLYLNGGLLFGVGLMPFSTAVLAEHVVGPGAPVAAGLFTGALLWVALFYNLIWRFLCAQPDRLLPTVSRRDRQRISRTYLVTSIFYALAFALAWVAPLPSVLITAGLAVFFAVIDRLTGFASEDIAEKVDAT